MKSQLEEKEQAELNKIETDWKKKKEQILS